MPRLGSFGGARGFGRGRVAPPLIVEYLVIAGGGAGGNNANDQPGGGGAGGYRTSFGTSGGGASAESALTLLTGTNYSVTIGNGASAGGNNGENSVFHTITSIGGGRGGSVFGGWTAPTSGGSGGGGGPSGAGSTVSTGAAGTASQGFAGGSVGDNGGSGGGGAGEAGNTDGTGHGGDGVSSSITGYPVFRAGGGSARSGLAGGLGGGGAKTSGGVGQAGLANTGGGGGAGGGGNSTGAAGGSGIVILRYPNTFSISVGNGLTASTINAATYKYTAITSGSGNVSFNESSALAAPRYWRYVEGAAVVSHHPRVSRIDLIDGDTNATRLVTYTSDNCSDSGEYQIGTRSIDLGAGNEKWFVNARIYSVFNGARSANFTLQYSYDNASWTTAVGGIMANYNHPDTSSFSCGLFFGYVAH